MTNGQILEKHIFLSEGPDLVSLDFLKKIESFNQYFIEDVLVYGEAENSSLDDLNLLQNQNYSFEDFYSIISLIQESKPLILIQYYIRGELNTSCLIYYLNHDPDIEGFYLTQHFHKSLDFELSSYEISKMREVNLLSINNFWQE